MTPEAIESLLNQWGDWKEQITTTSLGFPSKAPEARAVEGRGSGTTKTNAPAWVPGSRRISMVHHAIAAMPKQLREYVQAAYWVRASERDIAEYLECSRRQLGKFKAEAFTWIQAWAAACEKHHV